MRVLRVILPLWIATGVACVDRGGEVEGDVVAPSAGATALSQPIDPVGSSPIAEQQGVWPHVLVQLLEVKRISDGMLNVRFVLVNTATEGQRIEFGKNFAPDEVDADSVAGVFVTDSSEQKKYFVVRDADGRALCSAGLEAIAPGDRRELWAQIPAPPLAETTVSVHVPNVPVFRNVPITPGEPLVESLAEPSRASLRLSVEEMTSTTSAVVPSGSRRPGDQASWRS